MSQHASESQGAVPFDRATVADVMHRGLVTCPAGATVPEIAGAMARAQIHCVVVADAGGRRPWAVVTDLGLMDALASGSADAPAASLAVTDVPLVDQGAPLAEAARIMRERRATHVIVVDPGTAGPVGVVSTLDVARAAAQRPDPGDRSRSDAS